MLKFYFHDGVRAAAAESLPFLLDCAKIRGPTYLQEMWAYICPELLKAIESEPGVATSAIFCPNDTVLIWIVLNYNFQCFLAAMTGGNK